MEVNFSGVTKMLACSKLHCLGNLLFIEASHINTSFDLQCMAVTLHVAVNFVRN